VKPALLITLLALVLARPAGAETASTDQVPSAAYTHAARLLAVDGKRRLNLYCLGTGTPAVIFISGGWQNTMTWRRVQARVARSVRACSYDRAGLGFSDPATRDSSAANTVDDLKKLLDAARIKDPVVLVGHSVGGLYAMLFAATYRDRVAGLVLVDPSDPEVKHNLALSGQPREVAEESRRQTQENHRALRHCVDLARDGALTAGNTDPFCLMKEADPVLKKELDRQHVRLQTKEAILSEMISQEARVEGEYSLNALQFRKAIAGGDFGKLPLVLLKRAGGQKHTALPQEVFEKNAIVFKLGYERMAAYSSIGVIRPVSATGHDIQLDQPDAVVAAIDEVVASVRGDVAPAASVDAEKPLVGTWRVVSYVDTPKGGAPVHAFGENPIGQFIFTADGHMSVHLMHNPPAPKDVVADPDPDACVPSWYCAYFGTFELNAKESYWVTHVEGGNIPSFVGTTQKRTFRLQGDTLVIAETYMSGDVPVAAERVLVRESGSQARASDLR